eukprot:scaffold134755_cov37-Tisochrysis_lutea.AAC.1
MSQFHALHKKPEDLRSTAEVFSSVAQKADFIGSRFASGGKFTEQQFKAGEDTKDSAAAEDSEHEEGTGGAPGERTAS